ncbi:lysosomal acid glucosylceramidase-like isoform X1 [Neodiprion fabricii]|uniref:lysosomal acid glucosylceramidase-like isoform X1 n=1 Tax=Neodiprion fabricii TaxID=2872261 RepID=UPI001ED8D49A|nr:lysosomal acid glucosylceramidase-like isoform X1 [Neodiprion fabricii]
MLRCIFLLITCIYTARSIPCVHRDFGNNGTVCVCNATYCDSTPVSEVLDIGFYIRYSSSENGLRLDETRGVFRKECSLADADGFQLDLGTTFQPIHGFGGAFTDAASFNIRTLSPGAQENLLRTYFSKEGSNYNLGRVPIGGTDFSKRPYTYDDHEGDVLLKNFSLANEDLLYKIPLMKKALEINPEVKFFAAAWTAPPWMRTNHNYTGYGFLKRKYYQVYADYLVEFLNKYGDHGLEMWAMSTGNEPYIGTQSLSNYGSMGWLPKNLGKWIANNLGPTISKSKHNKTVILAYDDSRSRLDPFINDIFKNKLARNYTAGIAIHAYEDATFSASVLGEIRQKYPGKFLIMTEFSAGNPQKDTGIVASASWQLAEIYILNIIENLKNWVTGWVDWNLALDKYGGPNWRQNFANAPIIVNSEADEFYKQPTYYAITHFSKFIPPGSVRVGFVHGKKPVEAVAFKTLKNEIIVVMYNKGIADQSVTIYDPRRGQVRLQLPPKSIHTILYK